MGGASVKRKPARGRLDERRGFERVIGHSRAIARVTEQARHVASTRTTVLLEGEAGSGKGLLALAIHEAGPRAGAAFVRVTLSVLPGGAIEAELFGQERGAARGGEGPRRGRFELADGGTLYLDEIGEAPPAVQVRLLRAIQDRSFERIGGAETLRCDVRLIAGTQRDLAADVKAGRFREDLYYRLGAVNVRMPALRERHEDIPLLVEGFLRELNREHGRRVTGITRGVLERLGRHPWPGNVRELRNAVEGMVVFAHGRRPLGHSDLPDWLREPATESRRIELAAGMTVEEAERHLIEATLRHTGHDKPRAAAMLGIGLRTLYRKIKQHRIR
jgi:DNA-binding NtrC family response regulator